MEKKEIQSNNNNCFLCYKLTTSSSSSTTTTTTTTDKNNNDYTQVLVRCLKQKLNTDQDQDNQCDLNINAEQILNTFLKQQQAALVVYCLDCRLKLIELQQLIQRLEEIENEVQGQRGLIVARLRDVLLMKKCKFGQEFRKQLLQLRTHTAVSGELESTTTDNTSSRPTTVRRSSRRGISRRINTSKEDALVDCSNDDDDEDNDHDNFEDSVQDIDYKPQIVESDQDSPPSPITNKKGRNKDGKLYPVQPTSRQFKLRRMARERNSKSGQISIFYCVHSSCSAQFIAQDELTSHVAEIHLSAAAATNHIDNEEFELLPPASKYKEYTCPIDGANYSSETAKWELLKHNVKHHGYAPPKVWTCPTHDCNAGFPNQMLLNYHIKKQHEAPMVCPHCPRTFTHRGNFNRHVKTHSGVKDHLCELCCSAFTTAAALRDHCGHKHSEVYQEYPKYICTLCNNQEFNSKSNLTYHNALKHEPDKAKFKCQICGHLSNNASARDLHFIKHSDVRRFSCEACDATFKRKSHYKEHVLSKHTEHDKDNPRYICKICDKGFFVQGRLSLHVRRTHNNDKKGNKRQKMEGETGNRGGKKLATIEKGKGRKRKLSSDKNQDCLDSDSDDNGDHIGQENADEQIEVQESASQQISLTFPM